MAVILVAALLAGCAATTTTKQPVNEQIPVPASYQVEAGAAAYAGSGNHNSSPYFQHPDVYNMKNSNTLTVLSNYKTYHQTEEVTCEPAAALTVLYHYGNQDWKELEIAEIMQTHIDQNGSNTAELGVADEQGEYGTSTTGMIKFFKEIDWDVDSSISKANSDGYSFEDPAEFQKWVTENLNSGTPILVEWVDWMGHWQVIIGYDTMGTESFGDDVIIFADPYDTSDHWQDGYYIVPAERFFYMWQDKGILPEDQQIQQWLIAKPKA